MDVNTKTTYAYELELIRRMVLEMGALAEEAIRSSIKALMEKDVELAIDTVDSDDAIDRFEREIEAGCTGLIALQQPVANDLKMITCILKVITDLERMADHATKIARKAIILSSLPQMKPYVDLPMMAGKVLDMLKLGLDAFVCMDARLAAKVVAMDDEIDEYNSRIFAELVDIMRSGAGGVDYSVHLIAVTQSLERIADHVTNICERISTVCV